MLSLVIITGFSSCKNRSPENVYQTNPVIATNEHPIEQAIFNDSILYYNNFKSEYIASRNVEVWLPAGYPQKDVDYQVLYMHDGQNVLNKETAYYQLSWEMDEKMDSLLSINAIQPTIVVTAWNIPERRFNEYMPQMPAEATKSAFTKAQLKKSTGYDQLFSDNYLKFMTQELKPFIDQNFQTSTKAEDTFIMGSSMGGLISMYAMMEYPEIYGGAGCLSTHWPVPLLGEALIQEIPEHIPDGSNHKIYFDYGTLTLDKDYEPYQKRVDQLFLEKGYNETNFMSLKFEGHKHTPVYWNRRVAPALVFLLK